MLAMLLTLNLNHIKLYYCQKELIELGLGTADGNLKYVKLADENAAPKLRRYIPYWA